MSAQALRRPAPASHSRSGSSMKMPSAYFPIDLTVLLSVGPDCETNNIPYFPDYYFPGNGAVVGSGQIPIAASNNNNNNNAVGGKSIIALSTDTHIASTATCSFSRGCMTACMSALSPCMRPDLPVLDQMRALLQHPACLHEAPNALWTLPMPEA